MISVYYFFTNKNFFKVKRRFSTFLPKSDFCFLQFGVNCNFPFYTVLPKLIFDTFIGHRQNYLWHFLPLGNPPLVTIKVFFVRMRDSYTNPSETKRNETNRTFLTSFFHETNPRNESFEHRRTKRIHKTNLLNTEGRNESTKRIF